jgi:Flp pilus assembly protein TadG
MSSQAASTVSVRKALRRFCRNRRGSAAVEFALVAPVFFALLFAIIETGIMYFASQILETVTQQSARQVLTGTAQGASYADWAHFRDGVVCGQIPGVLTCSNIFVSVKSYPSCGAFSSVVISNPIDAQGNFDPSVAGYSPGGPGDTVVVQLFYQWPLFVTGLGYNIANLSNSHRLLVATAAFCNEPY